jgi:hypothetical protein
VKPHSTSSLSPQGSNPWYTSARVVRLYLPVAVLVALLVRMDVFFHLDTIMLGWRQADMSSVANNFLHNGFRLFYPQILWGGAGPGYVEMEFPIIPYLTAVLYGMFGTGNLLALIIPFLSSIGVVIATYKIGTQLFDLHAGFLAALLVAVSPLFTLASQTFLGEPALLLCTLLGVHFLLRWEGGGKISDLTASAIFTAVALLLKLTALYIGLPLLAIFWIRFGKKLFGRWEFWGYGIATILPSLLWYLHAHSLYIEYGNTFGIVSGGYNKFARMDLLLTPDFYVLMMKRISLSVVSPAVILFALVGYFARSPERSLKVLGTWIVALLAYTLLIAEGNKDMIYYQLPWLLPLALLGAHGFFVVMSWVSTIQVSDGFHTLLRVGCVAALLLAALGVSLRARYVPITVMETEARLRDLGTIVKDATPPSSLLVVASVYGNDKTPETIDTPPQMFYYSDRRGWYLALPWLTPSRLDSLYAQGARFLVIADSDVENLRNLSALNATLVEHYPAVVRQDRLLVFSLAGTPTK